MKKALLILLTLFSLTGQLAVVNAQASVDIFDDVCKEAPQNPSACKDKNLGPAQNPLYGPGGVITRVVNIISIVVGLAAVISIIWAGVRMITAGDNPEEVTKAREYVQYAIIGLVLALLAQALVRTVLARIGVTGT